MSPIEVMILMKFRPPSYLGSIPSPRQRRLSGITLTRYTPNVPLTMSQRAVKEIMCEVLRPLLACSEDKSILWHARPSFVLKQNENFDRVLIRQVQEMESLVRLYSAQHSEPMVPMNWLETLRASRLEMARRLRSSGQ